MRKARPPQTRIASWAYRPFGAIPSAWRKKAPVGDWRTWLYLAGRGAGKTRSGAEWIHEQVGAGRRRIALVAPTAADARDVMVEGESGILGVSPDDERRRADVIKLNPLIAYNPPWRG